VLEFDVDSALRPVEQPEPGLPAAARSPGA
jgi:hypothetical protein